MSEIVLIVPPYQNRYVRNESVTERLGIGYIDSMLKSPFIIKGTFRIALPIEVFFINLEKGQAHCKSIKNKLSD